MISCMKWQRFWEAAGMERGPLSLVRTNEEVLGINSSGSGLHNRDYRPWELVALTTRHPLSANLALLCQKAAVARSALFSNGRKPWSLVFSSYCPFFCFWCLFHKKFTDLPVIMTNMDFFVCVLVTVGICFLMINASVSYKRESFAYNIFCIILVSPSFEARKLLLFFLEFTL
jgi:hypothetical protein